MGKDGIMFIQIQDNVIAAIVDGNIRNPEAYLQVPDAFQGVVGMDLRVFDASWQVKPLAVQVAESIIVKPSGFKIVDNQFVPMSQIERYKDGVEPVPVGMVIDGDDIRNMTDFELNNAGLLDLPSWKEQQCIITRSILDERLSNGFPFQDKVIQADPVALQNANGFLTVITAGIDPLPIVWRTKDNTNITFNDADSFKAFAAQMLAFVQSQFHAEWAAKDAIRAAQDFDMAWAAYESYRNA
jgi:hypothetical protein